MGMFSNARKWANKHINNRVYRTRHTREPLYPRVAEAAHKDRAQIMINGQPLAEFKAEPKRKRGRAKTTGIFTSRPLLERVVKDLKAQDWSNIKIAEQTGISNFTVGKILEEGQERAAPAA